MINRRRFRVRKANPTPGDAHINVPLTNISVAYVQDATAFVADRAFPVVPVAQQSNLYYLYNKSDFLRDEAKPRAPATQSAGSGFALSTDSYACLVDAFHKDIDDQLRANADTVLQLDRSATEFVTQKLMLRRELKWTSKFFVTGVWATDHTPSTLWTSSSSDPGADVEVAKQTILQSTGFEPNTMVMAYEVFSTLRRNAAIRDQFKYTSADSIDEAMMARFFGIEKVLVLRAVYESAHEGATSSMSYVYSSKSVLVCYAAPAPSLLTPTAGYTFAWTGFTGGTDGWRIKRIRADLEGADRIEGEHALDMKVVASALGYFLDAVI